MTPGTVILSCALLLWTETACLPLQFPKTSEQTTHEIFTEAEAEILTYPTTWPPNADIVLSGEKLANIIAQSVTQKTIPLPSASTILTERAANETVEYLVNEDRTESIVQNTIEQADEQLAARIDEESAIQDPTESAVQAETVLNTDGSEVDQKTIENLAVEVISKPDKDDLLLYPETQQTVEPNENVQTVTLRSLKQTLTAHDDIEQRAARKIIVHDETEFPKAPLETGRESERTQPSSSSARHVLDVNTEEAKTSRKGFPTQDDSGQIETRPLLESNEQTLAITSQFEPVPARTGFAKLEGQTPRLRDSSPEPTYKGSHVHVESLTPLFLLLIPVCLWMVFLYACIYGKVPYISY